MTSSRPCYALATEWRLAAPVERVFDALAIPEEWPAWWPYVRSVACVARGDAQGIGSTWRYVWSSRLPYALTFDMTTTASHRPDLIEAIATGELAGVGRWRLVRDGEGSRVRYDWTVTTTRGWMNALAPLLRRVFVWNHDQVMAAGGRGLAEHLGVTLLAHHRLAHEDSPCITC